MAMPSPDEAVASDLLSDTPYRAIELIGSISIIANFVLGRSRTKGLGEVAR